MQNDNQAAIREMLKSFAYLLDEALKKTTKTYEGIVLSPTSDNRKWNVRYNNEIHAVKLYGSGTPTVNMMVKVIIPQGNQALAWFFVPGSGGGTGNGATFYPSVSEDGIISWTNDKSLPNPEPINIKGPQGDKGDTGATGPQGEKGDPGEAATIQIGTVTSGDTPAVSNSGTPQNAVFDFVLQQGLQGEQGIQGPQGQTGPQGPQGEQGPYFTPSVDSSGNLSWTNNGGLGNPSTVNIRGPQGIQGETGPQGPKGDDGLTTSVNGVEQVNGNITLVLSDFGVTASVNELNKLDGATVTTTEINYLDGVTSNIQGQINNKQDSITGAATTITDSNLTVSRALISNTNGKVAVSVVTSKELSYLDGVTSNIQAQLNSKISENIASLTLLSGSSNWTASNGKYYQVLTVSGMTTNVIPYVFPNVAVISSSYSSIMDSWNTVVQVESITNGIRIWANTPTSTNVPLTLHYI